jgi:transaldolase
VVDIVRRLFDLQDKKNSQEKKKEDDGYVVGSDLSMTAKWQHGLEFSTKNKDYPDTLYVDELIGPNTVNTMADASIDALHRGEGSQRAGTVTEGVDDAHTALAGLADAGVDFTDVTATLEREGVDSFADSYRDALNTIEKRRAEITS